MSIWNTFLNITKGFILNFTSLECRHHIAVFIHLGTLLPNILLILFLFKTSSSKGYNGQPEVDTPSGKIIGKTVFFRDIPVKSFLGVPFAKPPIGEYRFKKPYSVEKWTEPFTANHIPPACVQYSSNPFPWLDTLPNQSQDCLYLNMWVPTTSCAVKKSVMIWLFGGGFRIGSNRLDFTDGRVLAALGDVIVVAPNYRLGTEGFLYLGTEDAPGNMGLYDILEALKWVHSNIESFGGSKDNITVFGQSAGAIALGMLMVSPLTKGLFTRAIFQSGSPANLDAEDNDRDFRLSQAVAKAIGCMTDEMSLPDDADEVIRCLNGKDALELTKTVGKVSDNPQRGLYPRFGDEILPSNARESLIQGDFRNMPIFIGNNNNEGASMITKAYKPEFGFFGFKGVFINKTYGEYMIRKNFKSFPDTEAVVQQYLGSIDDDKNVDVRQQVQRASGDYARVCPSIYLAESVAAKDNHVFYYIFKHRSSESPWAPWMGVVHFDETPFVFGYPLRYPYNYTLEEQDLSLRMVNMWTTFAKNGYPRKNWPLFSRSHSNHINLNTYSISLGSIPLSGYCNFFRPYFGFT